MAQTETNRPLSFALWAENRAESKEQSPFGSALSSASCRRSETLSSVAPILRTSIPSLPYRLPFPWQRGHLYCAEQGTFLLCIDMFLAAHA
jgi:hypothetical protein